MGCGHGCQQFKNFIVCKSGDGPGEIAAGIYQRITGFFQYHLFFPVIQFSHPYMKLSRLLSIELINHFRDEARVLAHFERFPCVNRHRINGLGGIAGHFAFHDQLDGCIAGIGEGNDDKIIQR